MKTCGALVLILAASLLAAGAPAAAADPAGDVPHVIGGATPRDGVHELQLTELWRRGGEDDEEVLLGIVASVLTGDDGNLYVLDSQLMEVLVFGPDGSLLRTLGGQGQGPGEFQNAQRMVFLPGRDALGVAQTFPGKLVGINLDGTPAGDIRIGGEPAAGGFAILLGAELGGDNLVVSGMEIAFDQATNSMDRHHFVRSYGRDGQQKTQYHTKDVHWDFDGGFKLSEAENDYVWWRLAVDQAGRVMIAEPREEYRISVYDPDGTPVRVFGREYESLPRSPEMLARYERIMEAQSRQLPPGTATEVARDEQDVWGLDCQADGSVWVTTSRGMYQPPDGAFIAWDVFDPEGVYVRQVVARVPGSPGSDLMLLTEHDRAILVTGFWDSVMSAMGAAGDEVGEAEPMQIVCYRIES